MRGTNAEGVASDLSVALPLALDVSAVPRRPAGAGRYIVELAKALGRSEDVATTLVTRADDRERWLGVGAARVVSPVPASRPGRLAYERLWLGRFEGRLDAPAIAVHHGPHYTMPALPPAIGRVVTVHDLTFFDHPEWHEQTKVRLFRSAIRRAARVADVVVCVSTTTARRLAELVETEADVVVAEHGIDHDRFRPADGSPSSEAGESGDVAALAEAGFAPEAELLVHVGTLEPRKGVVDLVGAFDRIAGDHPSLELVLAGLPGWGAAAVDEATERSRFGGRIHRLGWVDDGLVTALMRRGAAVVYPSYEEGFGLPALEAMACGARLVTSSGTAMSEFAGGAAWTAPAGDSEALAVAIRSALRATSEEAGRRREEGLVRSSRFTWEASAAHHVDAYRLAAAKAAGRRRR